MAQSAGDKTSKRRLPGFLSRLVAERSSGKASAATASVASIDLPDDNTGPLGLTTLYKPPAPLTPIADLIFIHGLGGGSRKTWSFSHDPDHYWPQSWLPADDDFKDVRIHSFGYNSDWGARRQSVLDVRGIAQSLVVALRNDPAISRESTTRLILIGHSMGGFVAKSTYTIARSDPAAASLAARVHSMVFLATPHRGSSLASTLGNLLAALGWGKKSYVADLTRNSTALAIINDEFRHIAPDLRLWSFRETLSTQRAGFLNQLVVEPDSAALGFPHEEIVDMNADHRHVCKFESRDDPNYKLLRNALHRAVSLIREPMTAANSLTHPISTFPTARASPITSPTIPPTFSTTSPVASRGIGNALGSSDVSFEPATPSPEAISLLRSFLGVDESFEDDFATLQQRKEPGSCRWLTDQPSFELWRDSKAPGIMWLVGRPGAGKSILSGHVIEQLASGPDYCSYFIFKHAESTWSNCFRSLAFQMAVQDALVRDALLQLHRDGHAWDKHDETSVWRQLFTGRIFKLPSVARHFWVIDGVDECAGFNNVFTKRLLMSLPKGLKLFATSRDWAEIDRGVKALGPDRASKQTLSSVDTAEDMRRFLMTQLTQLNRPERPEDRETMCDKILSMSSGLFLWVRLVVQEFETVWTDTAMDQALEMIPADLSDLYTRMARPIEADSWRKTVARSILTWVVLACRPLTVDELRCAVELDIDERLHDAAKAIPNICAQLVFVDHNNRVQVIHETVREFLVNDSLGSGLLVHSDEGHTRLTTLLLQYLCSGVFDLPHARTRPTQRHTRSVSKLGSTSQSSTPSLILEYACAFFAEHLRQAAPSDRRMLAALSLFFEGSVLFWVEHIAERGDLTPIILAATNIREYLGQRTKSGEARDQRPDPIDRWPTELIRVAAKFRPQLLTCPSSIHHLIPPLCPSESLIAQAFGNNLQPSPTSPRVTVKGLPPAAWESDDCLIRMDFPNNRPTTVCHGIGIFAIGFSTGSISLYDAVSIQVLRKMRHPEPEVIDCLEPEMIHCLEFGPSDRLLASCGRRQLVIWDTATGTALHSFPRQSRPWAIRFLGEDAVLVASNICELTTCYLETKQHETTSWKTPESCYERQGSLPWARDMYPELTAQGALLISKDRVLLAVACNNTPIFLLSAPDLRLVRKLEHGSTARDNEISAMAFNPAPDLPTLVAGFSDGGLCIFNYLTGELQAREGILKVSSVSFSPDGRLLVVGTRLSDIVVFKFEQTSGDRSGNLCIIYRFKSVNTFLSSIHAAVVASPDGQRLVQIRSREGRVWAPAALARKPGANWQETSTRASENGHTAVSRERLAREELGWAFDIMTTFTQSADAKFIIAAAMYCRVVVASVDDPSDTCFLCVPEAPRRLLDKGIDATEYLSLGHTWDTTIIGPQKLMFCTNDYTRLIVYTIDLEDTGSGDLAGLPTKGATYVVDRWFSGPIGRVLFSPDGDRVLVRGESSWDRLCTVPSGIIYLPGGEVEPERPATSFNPSSPERWRLESAFQHPSNPNWFVIITAAVARIYSWTDFTELTRPEGIRLARITEPGLHLPSISYHVGRDFVIECVIECWGSSPWTRLYLWPASQLDPASATGVAYPAANPNLDAIAPTVHTILRVVAPSTIIFLDTKLWVCTVDVQSVTPDLSIAVPPEPRPSRRITGKLPVPPTPSSATVNDNPTSPNVLPTPSPPEPGIQPTPPTTLEVVPAPQARRHFFMLNEWHGAYREIQCTVLMPPSAPEGSGESNWRDAAVAFANNDRIVVIRGGFRFEESVVASTTDMLSGGVAGESVWKVVGGSMRQGMW